MKKILIILIGVWICLNTNVAFASPGLHCGVELYCRNLSELQDITTQEPARSASLPCAVWSFACTKQLIIKAVRPFGTAGAVVTRMFLLISCLFSDLTDQLDHSAPLSVILV